MEYQPQLIHLQHNAYIYGSGNIVEEGAGRLQEAEDQESLLYSCLF